MVDDSLHDAVEAFARLGEQLGETLRLVDALRVISDVASDAVPGADEVAVSRAHGGSLETVAATGDLPPRVDRIQVETGQGPCLDAMLERRVCRTGDVAADPRWPAFGQRVVAETGFCSMLSVPLPLADEDAVAALSFYAARRAAFPTSAEHSALLLATHAGVALTNERRRNKIENLERALTSSRDIGAAIGILMALHKVSRTQAFDMLRVASQHTNRKLADIATDVLETGAIDVLLRQ